jgi:hypothetical protein
MIIMATKGLVLFASLTASWVASLLAVSDFTSLTVASAELIILTEK